MSHGTGPKKIFHKGYSYDYIVGTGGNDVIAGGRGTQIVDAGGGDDAVSGGRGRDLLLGGTGADKLYGGSRGDLLFGGSGDDVIDSRDADGENQGNGADAVFGDGFDSVADLLKGARSAAPGHDTVRGGNDDDLIFGDNGDRGAAGGNDLLEGGRGDDRMYGEGGNDRMVGGRGADTMDGGAGADVFAYESAKDSRGRDVDVIKNFQQGQDKIDLTALLGAGGFKWGGSCPTANGVWFEQKGGSTFVYVDLNGNPRSPEMTIKLEGKFQLGAADFLTTANAPVNAPPVAGDDTAVTDEDTPVTISVLGNDSDADGDALTVTEASAGHGEVTINPDGTITYLPVDDFNGTDTITYTISDGRGGSATASVTVTVCAVNDAPRPDNDVAETTAGTPVTVAVLLNDIDPEEQDMDLISATAENGTVTINADGSLTYTPNAGFTGMDTVTYWVRDPDGATASATLTVTVTGGGNGAPVAGDDAATTDEDTAVTISVLANDSDPDGDPLVVTGASATNGAVAVNADGTLSYTPNGNSNGTDIISYTVSDGKGGTATATVAVTVNPVNDAPVAVNDAATLDEDTEITIDVLANDSDVDGDALTVSAASASQGTVTINGDGTLTYTPNGDFNGTDTITYTVVDGKGGSATATVAVKVNPVNDPPVAIEDLAATDEDTPVNIDVLANDYDPEGSSLSVLGAGAANGTVVVNGDGTLTYTPNANFNGIDTVTYTLSDSDGGVATGTVEVTVNSVNDAPVAVNDKGVTNEDTAVTIAVLDNDSDVDGDSLAVIGAFAGKGTVTINGDGTLTYLADANFNGTDTIAYSVSDGKGGTATATVAVTVNPVNDAPTAGNDVAVTDEDTAVTFAVLGNDADVDGDALSVTKATAGNGTVTINGDGTLSYQGNANFNGSDTVTYTISDGKGGTATAAVAVTVNPVNDMPTAGNDSAITNEDTLVRVAVLANDSDVDGDSLAVTGASAANGTVTINSNNTIDYRPNANFNGTDTVTYTVSDGKGGTATATVAVTVNPVNDAPVAVNDAATLDEDTEITIDVLANDSDVDGDALTVSAASASQGTVTINGDGTLTYTPNGDFNGTDTITYTVVDGKGGSATATVAVKVNPVNDPPVAIEDLAATDEDTPVNIDVLANDYDPEGSSLSVLGAGAANGTVVVNGDGTLTYTPNANFNGIDTVTYTLSDSDGGVATGTVEVTVNSVNDAPVAVNDKGVTNEDTAVTIAVLDNDSDVDGDSLAVIGAFAGKGTVTINGDGTLTYLADANFNGTDTIAYSVSDGKGGTATATVAVTVNAVNDAPVAGNDSAVTNEDGLVRIAVLANDSDVDGNPLSVVAASARNGTVAINPNNTLNYTPNLDYFGTDTITYTISDGQGGTATATVVVTINPVNDLPVANGETWYVSTAASTTVDAARLLANDSDVDGGQLRITALNGAGVGTAVTLANGVTLTLLADGNIAMTAPALLGAVTAATVAYTVSDGNGGTATATVSVNLVGTVVGVDTINLSLLPGGADPYSFTYIDGKTSSDSLTGTAGGDVLMGFSGNDTLTGGLGHDALQGGSELDNLRGEAGNDTLRGGAGNDTIDGGAGTEDMIDFSDATAAVGFTLVQSATATNAVLAGGLGIDQYKNVEGVVGSNFNDTLAGSAANDIIRGGGGNDGINGNGGVDVLDFGDATGALNFTLVQSSAITSFAAAGLGTDNYRNMEGVAGGQFNDTLTGSANADVVRGGGGNDIVSGGDGADTLRGGAGSDSLTGGNGADRFEYVAGDLAGSATDSIADFQTGVGGDTLDIADILTGFGGTGLENFVQAVDNGLDTTIRVDIDGTGTLFGFQNLAVLTGVTGSSLADLVGNGNLDAGP
jgi:Ca2+-binding RTX toxin-like protein